MEIDVLRERPFLTGLLLGLVLWLGGSGTAIRPIALLLFAVGVVGAIYGEGHQQPAGQALASSGAMVFVLAFLLDLFRALGHLL